jgi:ribosomal protein S12 methylthiotransferase accessory factor
LRLALFDLTTDTGTPTAMALVGPAQGGRYFDIAAGFGTHPIAARAAVKAITEAAQSRVTAIAGSRDDIAVGDYEEAPDDAVERLFAAPPVAAPPRGLPDGSVVTDGLSFMGERLAGAGVPQPVSVLLGGDAYGISVVRLLSNELEDRDANSNWRPGPRAISILLGAA